MELKLEMKMIIFIGDGVIMHVWQMIIAADTYESVSWEDQVPGEI